MASASYQCNATNDVLPVQHQSRIGTVPKQYQNKADAAPSYAALVAVQIDSLHGTGTVSVQCHVSSATGVTPQCQRNADVVRVPMACQWNKCVRRLQYKCRTPTARFSAA